MPKIRITMKTMEKRGETTLGKTIVAIAIVALMLVVLLIAAKKILSLFG